MFVRSFEKGETSVGSGNARELRRLWSSVPLKESRTDCRRRDIGQGEGRVTNGIVWSVAKLQRVSLIRQNLSCSGFECTVVCVSVPSRRRWRRRRETLSDVQCQPRHGFSELEGDQGKNIT